MGFGVVYLHGIYHCSVLKVLIPALAVAGALIYKFVLVPQKH